jgi:peptidoglycan-associated lipoprotein
MKSLFKFLMIITCVLLVSSCACKTKAKMQGSDFANIPVAEEGSILKDINFAFDQSELTPLAKSILQENSNWLRENPQATVTIEGHCDERGTREYNLALGQRRAQSAYDYLRGLGIAESRMNTVSYGEDQPLDPRSNEEAWARNRRAHFRVQFN